MYREATSTFVSRRNGSVRESLPTKVWNGLYRRDDRLNLLKDHGQCFGSFPGAANVHRDFRPSCKDKRLGQSLVIKYRRHKVCKCFYYDTNSAVWNKRVYKIRKGFVSQHLSIIDITEAVYKATKRKHLTVYVFCIFYQAGRS